MQRNADNVKAGHRPGAESSIFKIYGTELNQRREELMLVDPRSAGLGWEGAGFDEDELEQTRDWLRSRGNTIEGGTSEVQLNIIAKRVLDLPTADFALAQSRSLSSAMRRHRASKGCKDSHAARLTEDQTMLARTARALRRPSTRRSRACASCATPATSAATRSTLLARWPSSAGPRSRSRRADGGLGMGLAELVLVTEALGRTLAPEPLIPSVRARGSARSRAAAAARRSRPGSRR